MITYLEASTMNFDTILLDKALSALNEQLEIRKTPVIEIVVCGGSALQFLGLVDRRRFFGESWV